MKIYSAKFATVTDIRNLEAKPLDLYKMAGDPVTLFSTKEFALDDMMDAIDCAWADEGNLTELVERINAQHTEAQDSVYDVVDPQGNVYAVVWITEHNFDLVH